MIPTVGRIVHYIVPEGSTGIPGSRVNESVWGKHRAAMVVEIHEPEEVAPDVGTVDLTVFLAPGDAHTFVLFAEGVFQGTEPGTWHEPERATVEEPGTWERIDPGLAPS